MLPNDEKDALDFIDIITQYRQQRPLDLILPRLVAAPLVRPDALDCLVNEYSQVFLPAEVAIQGAESWVFSLAGVPSA